jgi:hypothetical protein
MAYNNLHSTTVHAVIPILGVRLSNSAPYRSDVSHYSYQQICSYLQSAQPSPYILWRAGSPWRLSVYLPPRHCTRPRGSAPLANASGVVWNLTVTRNRVRTHAIRPLVHTPLVIGKVRLTWLLCVNFCAGALSTVVKIVEKLTVPMVEMSVCESFYHKTSRPISPIPVCP